MTPVQAYTLVWNHLQAADLGIPIVGPADLALREDRTPWARITLRDYSVEDATIGSKRTYWTVGGLWVQVFVARGDGATIQLLRLKEKVEQTFNGQRLGSADDPLIFSFGALDVLDADPGERNWQQAVGDLPYRYIQGVADVA